MEVANNEGFKIPERLRESGIKFVPLRPKSKAPCETGFRGKPKEAENIERHVAAGGNYAVLAGTGGVLVVDCDTPEAKEVADAKLPETFTVRTGKKGFHHYFRCPEISGTIRLRKEKVQYGEIISTGGLATGPGSIHPDTGRVYEVVRDVHIADISGEALRAVFADFITMDSVSGNDSDKTSERSDIEILPVVEKFGIQLAPRGDLLEGPHPVHGSSSGNNFLVDPAKNLWHCFRCGTGGDALGLVAVIEGLMECSEAVPGGLRGDRFKKTILIARKKYGLEIEPFQTNEPVKNSILESQELKTLEEQIKLVPPDTDKAEILTMLEPMLREIAKLNHVQGNAVLRHVVRPHFSLTTQETKDYESLLKQYRKVPVAQEIQDETLDRGDLIDFLENATHEKRIHPAQDFIDGQLYFGIKIKDVDCVVRSDREICKLSDLNETYGITPTQTFVGTNHFSSKGIAKFLKGDGRVSSHELFRRIKDEYLKRYYWFQYEEDAVFLTIWIMGTYVYRIFQYYPYAWLKASKNSGKTHLLNLSAMLAFNGDSSVTPTEAVLFRDVSENLVTMCVDEVEKLRSVDKEKYGAIMSLLNAGFQKDGKVKRVEKDESGQFATKSFSVYSPKILAGINHLEDVLQDRTVRLDIIRKMKGEPAERLKKNRVFQEFITGLRDDCYVWALEHAGDIAEMIDSDEVSRIDWFRDLVNRDLDLWEPIVFIGTLVDRAAGNTLVSESLARKSQKSVEEKQENNEFANDQIKTVRMLLNFMEKNPVGVEAESSRKSGDTKDIRLYLQQEVLRFVKENQEFDYVDTTNKLTRILTDVNVKSKEIRVKGSKQRAYVIDIQDIENLRKRYFGEDPNQEDGIT